MLDRIITHADLLKRINALGRDWRLVGPVARPAPGCDPPTRWFYQPVVHAEQLDLAFPRCEYGPKSWLLPAVETLFTFDSDKRGFTCRPVLHAEPVALVGVHPCDVHAIRLLDQVFAQDTPDPHYLGRRENTFVVGVDCGRPCDSSSFCGDMDTHHAEEGFDVLLYPLDGGDSDESRRYGAVFGSDAGRAWLIGDSSNGDSRPAQPRDERDLANYQRRKEAAFVPVLRTPGKDLPAVLAHSYDSLLWEATARRCYSCGSCNLVCPTCYCFDIRDDVRLGGGGGSRERYWDGCQLREFAVVAGGHNFRPKAAERLRHRVFRKGMWIQQRTGQHGCVGCGRCDRACTAKISIAEIFNQLAEER